MEKRNFIKMKDLNKKMKKKKKTNGRDFVNSFLLNLNCSQYTTGQKGYSSLQQVITSTGSHDDCLHLDRGYNLPTSPSICQIQQFWSLSSMLMNSLIKRVRQIKSPFPSSYQTITGFCGWQKSIMWCKCEKRITFICCAFKTLNKVSRHDCSCWAIAM